MSELIVIAYPSEAVADDVRRRLFELQNEYLIQLGDAVVATKSADGHVKLNQLFSTTAAGAVTGSFWGLLVGAIFLMPALGAAVGAASGALGGALADFGINDKFMKDLASSIQPGSAALFILANKITADKVIDRIKDFGGVVLKTSLDRSKEESLREALSSATRTMPPASPPAPAGSSTSVPSAGV